MKLPTCPCLHMLRIWNSDFPDSKVHWANMRPTGPRWAPCWLHELCYLGAHAFASGTVRNGMNVIPCFQQLIFAYWLQSIRNVCPVCIRHVIIHYITLYYMPCNVSIYRVCTNKTSISVAIPVFWEMLYMCVVFSSIVVRKQKHLVV